MRFSIEASAAAIHSAFAAKACSRKSTVPILGCVLLSVEPGRLSLLSTSLDIWARSSFEGDCEGRQGVAVDADLLRRFCAVAPKGSRIEGALEDHGNVLRLAAGRTKAAFPALPAEDFPLMPADSEKRLAPRQIDAAAFGTALRGAVRAAATDDARYYLNGVFFEERGLLATDGHRLIHMQLEGMGGPAILPREAVPLVCDLLADGGRFGIDESAWLAESGDFRLVGKCVDGSFPDWTRVVPHDPPVQALFARQDIQGALKAVAFHDDRARAVVISADADAAEIKVAMRRSDGGAVETAFPADVRSAFRTGFNAGYLDSVLEAMPDAELAAHFGDGGSPAKVWPADGSAFLARAAVVMPMRV